MQSTTVTKDPRSGWLAHTDIELADSRLLRIETRRRAHGGGVTTTATVYKREDGMLSRAYDLYGPGGDYREQIGATATRATEVTVRTQHADTLQKIEGVKARALAHYARMAQPRPA